MHWAYGQVLNARRGWYCAGSLSLHARTGDPTLKALASRRSFWRSALVRWRSRLCSRTPMIRERLGAWTCASKRPG